MTSSPERAIEPLPPALSSMWRLCVLGYQHEPGLMLFAFGLALFSALPDAANCGSVTMLKRPSESSGRMFHIFPCAALKATWVPSRS